MLCLGNHICLALYPGLVKIWEVTLRPYDFCVSCVQDLIVYFEAENCQNNEVSFVSFIYFHANFNNLREIIFCTIEFDFEFSTLNWISLHHSAELGANLLANVVVLQ